MAYQLVNGYARQQDMMKSRSMKFAVSNHANINHGIQRVENKRKNHWKQYLCQKCGIDTSQFQTKFQHLVLQHPPEKHNSSLLVNVKQKSFGLYRFNHFISFLEL